MPRRSKEDLARQAGISPTSVYRNWCAFGLQPWRTEDFKVSSDPLLNAAVFAVD